VLAHTSTHTELMSPLWASDKGHLACCRAGLKLDAALAHFGVDAAGRTALDAGLSTGGFADCLLQRGAAQVYGVDVGHAQVRHWWC
jgi:predicted rRNA methylase YqxC with S4 and FtsJ domains